MNRPTEKLHSIFALLWKSQMKEMIFVIKHSLFRYKYILPVCTLQTNACLRILAGIVVCVGREEEGAQILEWSRRKPLQTIQNSVCFQDDIVVVHLLERASVIGNYARRVHHHLQDK
jgi:hypothetical protein